MTGVRGRDGARARAMAEEAAAGEASAGEMWRQGRASGGGVEASSAGRGDRVLLVRAKARNRVSALLTKAAGLAGPRASNGVNARCTPHSLLGKASDWLRGGGLAGAFGGASQRRGRTPSAARPGPLPLLRHVVCAVLPFFLFLSPPTSVRRWKHARSLPAATRDRHGHGPAHGPAPARAIPTPSTIHHPPG